MVATFHYKQDGRWHSMDCPTREHVPYHVEMSRTGLEGGDEEGFYIEWH